MTDPAPITPQIDISPEHWEIVDRILEKHVPGYEVWAFGSRAARTSRRYSDLDLAIISDAPLPNSITGEMAEAFTESDLPWKVDVLDWAITNERFKKIIERDRVVLRVGRCAVSGKLT